MKTKKTQEKRTREQDLAELLNLIQDMDIPVYRKRVEKQYDRAWLGRNMAIRNKDNPNFSRALQLIRILK